jgi:hypothetical protein
MILWGLDTHWALSLPAISALLAERWLIAIGYAGSSYRTAMFGLVFLSVKLLSASPLAVLASFMWYRAYS